VGSIFRHRDSEAQRTAKGLVNDEKIQATARETENGKRQRFEKTYLSRSLSLAVGVAVNKKRFAVL